MINTPCQLYLCLVSNSRPRKGTQVKEAKSKGEPERFTIGLLLLYLPNVFLQMESMTSITKAMEVTALETLNNPDREKG